MNADDREAALALLRWYIEMGADEAIGSEPADRLAPSLPPPAPIRGQSPRRVPAVPPPAPTDSMGEPAQSARRLASPAGNVAALAALVARFDGCPTTRVATRQ